MGTAAFCQGLTLSHRLLDTDEAGYAAIAGLMNAGSPLYGAGGVDNKPPAVFWIDSVLFRAAGLYNLVAVHAFKVAVVLVTAAVVGAIARRVAAHAAWPAALLYVAFTAAGYPQMAAANTEVFMMLPAAVAVLLLLERRWAAAGVAVAVASLTKQVAVLELVLLPLAAIQVPAPRWKPVVSGLAGFAAGGAVLLGVVVLTGSLSGFWHWAVVSLVTGYGPSVWSSGQAVAGFRSGFVPWVEATLLLWVPALLRLPDLSRERSAEILILGWAAASLAGAFAGGHFFGHYFIAVVGPLAVLSGACLAEWRSYVRRAVVAAAAVVLLAVPAVRTVLADYRVVDPAASGEGGHPSTAEYDAVSLYVAAHTSAGQRIFVWGNWPSVYVVSGRLPATRFVGFLRGGPRGPGIPPRTWDTTAAVWPLLGQDLTTHPPELVVDTSTADWATFGSYPMTRFPVLPEIVAQRYERVAVVDGVTIYRLR